MAFNIRTGTLTGGFALGDEGEFQIAGLSPGAYVVRVEPLDDGDDVRLKGARKRRRLACRGLQPIHDQGR